MNDKDGINKKDLVRMGERIKELRNRAGLSNPKLASMIGVSTATVTFWERGDFEPKRKNIDQLSSVLNTSSEYILKGHSVASNPIGYRIRKLRKKANLSQDDIAGVVGVSRVSVSQWETQKQDPSKPKGEHLIKLCNHFNVTPEYVLFGSEGVECSGGISVGQRIRALRMRANLTQANVAVAIGVKAPAVTQWESNSTLPSGKSLIALAAFLSVTPEYILYGNNKQIDPNGKESGCDEYFNKSEAMILNWVLDQVDWQQLINNGGTPISTNDDKVSFQKALSKLSAYLKSHNTQLFLNDKDAGEDK